MHAGVSLASVPVLPPPLKGLLRINVSFWWYFWVTPVRLDSKNRRKLG